MNHYFVIALFTPLLPPSTPQYTQPIDHPIFIFGGCTPKTHYAKFPFHQYAVLIPLYFSAFDLRTDTVYAPAHNVISP